MEIQNCVLGAVEKVRLDKEDGIIEVKICKNPPKDLKVLISYDTRVVRDYFTGRWWDTYNGEYTLDCEHLIWRGKKIKIEYYEEPDDVIYFQVKKSDLEKAIKIKEKDKKLKAVNGKLVEYE